MQQTISKLYLPPQQLSACIFASIYRDTRGCALTDAQRINRFPASPLCTITWVLDGDIFLTGDDTSIPKLSFSGPQSAPILSYSPNAIQALTIAFFPESWQVLTGIDVLTYKDKTVALSDIATPQVLSLFETMLQDIPLDDRRRVFEAALLVKWKNSRTEPAYLSNTLQDWFQSVLVKTATSETGQGLRQIQRRLKNWTGQNKRELAAYARMETVFIEWFSARENPDLKLADFAFDAGISDQSHMGREVKRIVGLSPAELNKLIETDESFWFYRLMGERR